MIKTYYADEISADEILYRTTTDYSMYDDTVKDIIANVREKGDSALYEYAEKFDKVKLHSLKVSDDEIADAYEKADKNLIATIERAKKNIEEYHKRQLRSGFEYSTADGAILGQKIIPVESVCVYVPGGTAVYPSTVLMDIIPARLAGVEKIYMTTPPDKCGGVNANILVAAKIAGASEIYKIGGAQAVAAFAYGTESVPKADKIVGPGNIYVATAKRAVYGEVSIDMIAGPSEILVVADGLADAKAVAADMLSQAEHDRLATAILITDCEKLAADVQNEIERQLALLPRQEIARQSINNNGKIIVTENPGQAVEIANKIAPEHLELAVENPFEYLDDIKNAGSVFLGYNTPEAVGDYFSGANHTLPTNGTARFSSAMSVDDFIKKTQYIYYSDDALKNAKDDIVRFAEGEGLDGHARSVTLRFED